MTDLLTRLTDARPTDSDLDAMWSPADRAALLGRLSARRRPGRRTALLVAAAAVAAVAVVPTVLDSGDATAADLRALALSAASYDGPVLAEGNWLHETTTSLQTNHAPYQGGAVYEHAYESWTRWDGRYLVVDHEPRAGWTSYDVIDGAHDISSVDDPREFHDQASYQDPTPEFAATLPGTADGLLAYLDPLVLGASSHQEAMFSALADLATSHTLPPRTLAATFGALAEVDDVHTEDVTVQGRAGVEVRFRDRVTSSTQTLVVDRATGQVLSTSEHSRQSDYTSTTTLSEVVPAVPDDVLDAFRAHSEGVRYDVTGTPLPPD